MECDGFYLVIRRIESTSYQVRRIWEREKEIILGDWGIVNLE